MKKYSNIQYALINLLGIALDMDKKSYEERLDYARTHDWKSEINAIELTDKFGKVNVEQVESIEAVMMYNDVKKGSTRLKMMIDMGCSGASLHEILSRFIGDSIIGKAMKKKEILDLYRVLFDMYMQECKERNVKPTEDGFVNFTRKVLKKGIIPWFYNGEAEMKRIVGKDNLEIFREIYAKALPGSEGFRRATLDGWNSKAYSYAWEGPDGAQIEFAVLGDPTRQGINIEGMRLEYNLVENEPREMFVENKKGDKVRNTGVKCLGANLTHSIDRYCLYEVVRMVHITKGEALEILSNCAKSKKSWKESEQLVRLYDCYKKQNVVSVRWLYLVKDNPVQLPEEIEKELIKIAEEALGSKAFDVMVIHDAFGCTVNHMNRLRLIANYVLASLYKSTIMEYWNEQFGLNIPVKAFDEGMYEQIKQAEYLFN